MNDIEILKKQIGQRLRVSRKAKNLTQDSLSEKIGLATKSYSAIETGAKLFSIEVLLKLMAELEVSADFILKGYSESMTPIDSLLQKMSPENISRAEKILVTFYEAIQDDNIRK